MTASWLIQAGFVIAASGAVLAAVSGAALLLAPAAALRMAQGLNPSKFFNGTLRRLERARKTEPFFYRHHRAFGAFIFGLSLFFLMAYFCTRTGHELPARLAMTFGSRGYAPLLEGVFYFFAATHALFVVFGLVVFFRPSLLKTLETRLNVWINTRVWFGIFDRHSAPLDRVATAYPRATGLVFLVLSAYLVSGVLGLASAVQTFP